MLVHIFRGDGRVFGFTAERSGSNLPTGFGAWTHFKSVEMVRGESQPGVDVDECLDDLASHGFHLTDAHVRITDKALD